MLYGKAYADLVKRDKPECWWRIAAGVTTPSAVGATTTTLLEPTGSGSNLPYAGPRIIGAPDGSSSHCVGSISTTGQGWATSATHTLPTTSYTMEVWAYATAAPSANSMVIGRYNKTASASDRNVVAFYVTSGLDIRFTAQASATLNRIDTGVDGFLLGRWNHIVVSVDGTVGSRTATVWVNGRFIRSQTSAHDASGAYFTGVGTSGVAPTTTTNYRSWPGYLAEPAVYPYALSAQQVIEHYQTGMAALAPLSNHMAFFGPAALVPINTDLPAFNNPQVEFGYNYDVSDGTWSGVAATYAYQWYRCDNNGCTEIVGETNSSYTVALEDVGYSLKVAVTATNEFGSATAETVESDVVPAKPIISSLDIAIGPVDGGTLITATGHYFTGTTSVTVDGNAATFTVVDDNTLTFTTPAGTAGSRDVLVTNAEGTGIAAQFEYSNLPFVLTQASIDNNSPNLGDTLTADPGTWANSPTLTYQWYRILASPPGGPEDFVEITGETSSTYTTTSADVGLWIGVQVVGTNDYGTADTAAITTNVVVDTSVPAIDTYATFDIWEPDVGDTITLDPGTWTGNPTSYAYQWFQVVTQNPSGIEDFIELVGETGLTYTVAESDAGYWIGALVSATNANGTGTFGVLTQAAVPGSNSSATVTPSALATAALLVSGFAGVVSDTVSPVPLATPSTLAAGFAGVISDTISPTPVQPDTFFTPGPVHVTLPQTPLAGTVGMHVPTRSVGPTPTVVAATAGFAPVAITVETAPGPIAATTALGDEVGVLLPGTAELAPTVTFVSRRYGTGVTADTIVASVGFAAFAVQVVPEPDGMALGSDFGQEHPRVVPEAASFGAAAAMNAPVPWQGVSPDGIGVGTVFPPVGIASSPSLSSKNIVVFKHNFTTNLKQGFLPAPWRKGTNDPSLNNVIVVDPFTGQLVEADRFYVENVAIANAAYRAPSEIAGILVDAYNIELRANVDGEDVLVFSYPAALSDSELLRQDSIVELMGRRYRISTIKDGRNADGTKFFDVECDSLALDLAKEFTNGTSSNNSTGAISPNGELKIEALTVRQGLEKILAGSTYKGWSIGVVEHKLNVPESKTYSMTQRANSVMELLKQWSEVVDLRVVFDTRTQTINFYRDRSENPSFDSKFRLEYAKNIIEIRREIKPPEATCLYPYGRDGVDITKVNNNGLQYIEDYSWYETLHGISTKVARRQFYREMIWETDDYITSLDLFNAAQRKLQELSRPSISYEIQMASLPDVGELFVDVNLYDIVTVRDADLGIDIRTQVVGMTRFWDEPWRDEIQLSYLKPLFGDKKESSTSADSRNQSGGIIGMRTVTQQYVVDWGDTSFDPISVSSYSAGKAFLGYSLSGTVDKPCRLEIRFIVEASGAIPVELFPPIKQAMAQGWNTVSGTFFIPKIDSGSLNFRAQARLYDNTNVIMDVPAQAFSMYIYGDSISAGGTLGEVQNLTWSDAVPFAELTTVKDSASVAFQIPLSNIVLDLVPEDVAGIGDAVSDELAKVLINPSGIRFEPQAQFPSVTVITL